MTRRCRCLKAAGLARVIPGEDTFYHLGDDKAAPCGTGKYEIDQTSHWLVMFLVSLMVAAFAA